MTDPVGYRRPSASETPPYLHPAYGSTVARAPRLAPVPLAATLSEVTGPRPGAEALHPNDADLTKHGKAAPLGERIVVHGRVLDGDGRPVPHALVEVWQCNASGRYRHEGDQHDAPIDPNFVGVGRCVTDATGAYRYMTIKPGAYPWRNHHNAWRPAHIHYSLFGPAFSTRLITQMYFPGDPLLAIDPIYNSTPDPKARERMICGFDLDATMPEYALAYRFDIVLRGRNATPMET